MSSMKNGDDLHCLTNKKNNAADMKTVDLMVKLDSISNVGFEATVSNDIIFLNLLVLLTLFGLGFLALIPTYIRAHKLLNLDVPSRHHLHNDDY